MGPQRLYADTLVVFGQGPVEEGLTEYPDQAARTGRLNIFCEMNARAAGVLHQQGVVKRIILTGGKTGGDERASEAELMRMILISMGIPPDDIVCEDKSLDTGENFVNVINLLDSPESQAQHGKKVAMLASHHHLARVGEMGEIYLPPNKEDLAAVEGRFSAEEVLIWAYPEQKNVIWELCNPQIDEQRERPDSYRQEKMQPQNRWLHPVVYQPKAAIPKILLLQNEMRIRLLLSNPRYEEILTKNKIAFAINESGVITIGDSLDVMKLKLADVGEDIPSQELQYDWPEHRQELEERMRRILRGGEVFQPGEGRYALSGDDIIQDELGPGTRSRW
jgi:hypothetical protein